MDEPLQLANATTTESLLELRSALDASLSNWNEELSTGSNKTHAEKHGGSLSTHESSSLGLKIPQNHLNVMQN